MALATFDDGSGTALYAGGDFKKAGSVNVKNIAKWNGTAWTALGTGMTGSFVRALTAIDSGDPGGPALYAGGQFSSAGGVAANNIAWWNGATWSAVGSGLNGPVEALTTFDDGAGIAVYAGGSFTKSGSLVVRRVAKWNGAWSSLAGGINNGAVYSLTVGDEVSGTPVLYVGGSFSGASSTVLKNAASWDGASWAALGNGTNGAVATLVAFEDDEADGLALYAGGNFTTAGGLPAAHIARWARDCAPALLAADGGAPESEKPDGVSIRFDPIDVVVGSSDLDFDGDVDGADLALLVENWGLSSLGDLDASGVVDTDDLAILLANWGLGGSFDDSR